MHPTLSSVTVRRDVAAFMYNRKHEQEANLANRDFKKNLACSQTPWQSAAG